MVCQKFMQLYQMLPERKGLKPKKQCFFFQKAAIFKYHDNADDKYQVSIRICWGFKSGTGNLIRDSRRENIEFGNRNTFANEFENIWKYWPKYHKTRLQRRILQMLTQYRSFRFVISDSDHITEKRLGFQSFVLELKTVLVKVLILLWPYFCIIPFIQTI